MTVVKETPPAEPPPSPDALIPEARVVQRKRRRRRSLLLLAVGLTCCVVAAGVYLVQALSDQAAAPGRASGNGIRGAAVVPRDPVSLAIGPGGVLYIADPGRQQILKRLSSGRFEVAVGTGVAGDSGDGGLATHAAIYSPSSMAVTSSGALYFVQARTTRPTSPAGSSVVREVTPNGKISTVIGAHPDCHAAGATAQHTPAEDADLLGGASLAITPTGHLSLSSFSCPNSLNSGPLLELTSSGQLVEAPHNSTVARYVNCDGPLAYSVSGALYVGCTDGGGSTRYGHPNDLLLVEPNGRAKQFLPNPHNAPFGLTPGPTGTAYTVYLSEVVRVSPKGARVVVDLSGSRPYDKFLGRINNLPGRMEPSGIAVDRRANIYLTAGSDGNGTFNGIIEVQPKPRVRVLWTAKREPGRRPPRNRLLAKP